MLKRFSLENFKSFQEKAEFDLTKTDKYSHLPENSTGDVFKAALFIGPNSSGKTSAVSVVFSLIQSLIYDDYSLAKFSNVFVKKDIKLFYEFEIESDGELNDIQYWITYNIDKNIHEERLLLNGEEVFSTTSETVHLRQFYKNGDYKHNNALSNWIEFIQNSVVLDLYNRNEGTTYKGKLNPDFRWNQKMVEDVNVFLEEYNFGTTVIKPDDKEECAINELSIKNKKFPTAIPFSMGSVGSKTLVYLLPIVLDLTNYEYGMLLLDEYGSGLHNELEELILKYFQKKAVRSQIFLISHSTNLLKNSLLRADQIYAIDMNEDFCSSYERLSDQNPRVSQNLEKMYLGGVFGGLPQYKL